MTSRAETYLAEAQRITDGARQDDYGHPLDNHERTAALWSAFLGTEISAEQVVWLNVLQKLSREAHRSTRDNRVDVIGYVRNLEQIDAERARRLHALEHALGPAGRATVAAFAPRANRAGDGSRDSDTPSPRPLAAQPQETS